MSDYKVIFIKRENPSTQVSAILYLYAVNESEDIIHVEKYDRTKELLKDKEVEVVVRVKDSNKVITSKQFEYLIALYKNPYETTSLYERMLAQKLSPDPFSDEALYNPFHLEAPKVVNDVTVVPKNIAHRKLFSNKPGR